MLAHTSDPLATVRVSSALTPARLAAIAVAAVGGVRLLAAFMLHGPVLMPDEYFYSAIARSVAHGGPPTVRGGHLDFISVLAPILTAPAWLIHDMGIAYRVAQVEGVLAMTLAALPVLALSRRVGLSERAAAVAAVFAVLVPDLALSGFLLSEPFAYPLFFTAVLCAVDALERRTARRQALFLVAAGALCLTRLQFVFLPIAYLAAAMITTRPFRLSSILRSHRLVSATVAVLAAAVGVIGLQAVAGRYSGLGTFGYAPSLVLHWSGANLVLLLLTAGWVTAPGAALGLVRQVRGRAAAARAFGTLTVLVATALLVEAGIFGAGLGQLEERYTFYAAPLLVIAFLFAAEQRLLATRAHGILAGAMAGVAVFLPLDDPLFTGLRDQSPVLVAFAVVQRHAQWRAPLVAGVLLVALGCASFLLGRRGSSRLLVGLASALVATAGVGCTLVLSTATQSRSQERWRLGASPRQASFLAFAGNTVPGDLTTALFWNPDITRVLVIGGKSVDGFASARVRLGPGGRLLAGDAPVRGPVVFQRRLDTVRTRGASTIESGRWGLIADASRARISELVSGWSSATGAFAPNGQIAAAAEGPRERVQRTVRLWLRDPTPGASSTRLRFECSDGVTRTVSVGSHARTIRLPLVGRGVASCRFALVSGHIRWRDGYAETVQARVGFTSDLPSESRAGRLPAYAGAGLNRSPWWKED
jgi:hypothetical protein